MLERCVCKLIAFLEACRLYPKVRLVFIVTEYPVNYYILEGKYYCRIPSKALATYILDILSQFVTINGTKSNLARVTSGVPQCSHLSPLLFNNSYSYGRLDTLILYYFITTVVILKVIYHD